MNPADITKEIQKIIAGFQKGFPALEKQAFGEIQSMINELKLLPSGHIRQSVENLRKIARIKAKLQGIILNPEYEKKVSKLNAAFDKITNLQTEYFAKVFTNSRTAPAVIDELRKVTVKSTLESLSASRINVNIIDKVGSILEDNITSGKSFSAMNKELSDFILGSDKVSSKLASYSDQVLTDSLSQYAANYSKIKTDDLGLDWFQYVGPLVKDSRPICEALVHKEWIHKSELGSIAAGVVDGRNVGTAGMISGTNAGNFQVNRGGYFCNHLLIPVAKESVPVEIREKFDTEKD